MQFCHNGHAKSLIAGYRNTSAAQSSQPQQQHQQPAGASRGPGRSSSPAPTVLPMGVPLPGPPPGRSMGMAGSPAAPAFGRGAPRGAMAGGPGRGMGRGLPPMGLSPLGTATGASLCHQLSKGTIQARLQMLQNLVVPMSSGGFQRVSGTCRPKHSRFLYCHYTFNGWEH